MKRAPWSDIGRLQSDVTQLKNDLRRKPDAYEITTLNRRMDDLERSVRELSSKVDGLLSELQQLQTSKGEHYGKTNHVQGIRRIPGT